jgi:hypothetical protein
VTLLTNTLLLSHYDYDDIKPPTSASNASHAPHVGSARHSTYLVTRNTHHDHYHATHDNDNTTVHNSDFRPPLTPLTPLTPPTQATGNISLTLLTITITMIPRLPWRRHVRAKMCFFPFSWPVRRFWWLPNEFGDYIIEGILRVGAVMRLHLP